ncbi:phosphoribosylformylglycinamidine synthase [Blattabacterium cuenoti]|uniref:phosphoribosylformylglycinamidine synthase n=1 Tax=Blattabacterium cuenoti TaxID=1653831 RepID=UPI00163C8AC5|nr:phosphoribosylformylglycinamidine synthase [Blattabacterium cuenoti]
MISFNKSSYRIYIRSKSYFDKDSIELCKKLRSINIFIHRIIIYRIYEFFHIKKKFLVDYLKNVLVDPVTEIFYFKKYFDYPYFECNSNNDDHRSSAAMLCMKIFNHNFSKNVLINSKLLIELVGLNKNSNKSVKKIKNYIVENYSYFITHRNNFYHKEINIKNHINYIKDFKHYSINKIEEFHKKYNLSIDIKDLLLIQKYFLIEKRDPSLEEILILNTYWSDHCRHTTFFTELENICFRGFLKNTYKKIFSKYLEDKKSIGKSKKPINLMELSQLPYEIIRNQKKLNFVSSDENNACTIIIDVHYLDKKRNKEKWYLLFKNETHNHPTEGNPFNGANTCIGGAIRDPLSGRSFVYQGIRISGSSDPNEKNKIYGKIPENKICLESAYGFSSYGNQIGLATTHVSEIYHKGYRAKRLELGMVVGAAPVTYIKWKKPKVGDIILLIGGLTRKEGIGGASESSKNINDIDININNQQKGNPLIERNIQRLFRKKEVTNLIKKCNDLGAGGLAVSLGELHNSVEIYLEKVPINEKILPIEIALSESQERMAIVVDPKNAEKIIKFSHKENLICNPIAKITNNNRIVFLYNKKVIFDVKSTFLNTRGYKKKNKVIVDSPNYISPFIKSTKLFFSKKNFLKTLSNLNIASQLSLIEMFDSTVGGTTVLMPFGGKYQMTPAEGSVQKIPVFHGSTETVSMVTWGFHPKISTWSPFHGGAYAVLECISKIVSMGGNYKNVYLSFQEYYKKMEKNPKNWGIPFSSLLGAYHAQMELEIVCLGGKDSMSGTYKNIHVPPTLISFGITTDSYFNVISPEFKKIGSKIYLYNHMPLENEMPNFNSIKNAYDKIHEGVLSKKIISLKTVKDGGIAVAIAKMSFGNKLGAEINCNENLLKTHIGSLIIESSYNLSKDFILIGKVINSKNLIFNSISIAIDEAIKNWSKKLLNIFSPNENRMKYKLKFKRNITIKEKKIIYRKNNSIKIGTPNVFIPIFPGTNGELESIRVFKNSGAIVKNFVFNNVNDNNIIESIFSMKKYIESVQILMLCGGFSAGDEPDGSAKLIISILHNPYIKESIQKFLEKGGLILGICNGFQGLIKSGLLPYGKICMRDNNSPVLINNKVNKHISQCVNIKIISDKSPWLKGMKNKIYTIPISHGEGRFYAKNKTIDILFENNQVASQYVDLEGVPSLERKYNPNGSSEAIESLLSENGRIYGRMTHPERCFDSGLLKNIPNNVHNLIQENSIFKNAVQYFV